MKTDKLILKKWFARNGLSEGTRRLYERNISLYQKFIGKSLKQLIEEAENEQDSGIRPMKRLVNDQIMLFKEYLDETYAPGSVNNTIAAVNSFYKAFDIEIINIKLHQGDTSLDKNRGRLLTREEILKMLNVSNGRDRAIIYLMALTGLASNEVRNLSIRKFIAAAGESINKNIETLESLFEYEDIITKNLIMFEIVRKKVNYRHHVLMPPEVTRVIIAYLKERYFNRNDKRHIQNLDGPIFVTNIGKPMSRTGLGSEFKRIGFLAGFKKEKGAYCYWRPHGFRKYFITTIIKHTGDHVLADYLVGHAIDSVKRAYWIITPEELKKKYLSVLEYLSIDSVRVHDIYSEKFNELLEDSIIKDQKIAQLEDKFKAFEKFSKTIESFEEHKNQFQTQDLNAIISILEKQKLNLNADIS